MSGYVRNERAPTGIEKREAASVTQAEHNQ